ncbi:hypothetical protein NQZ68_004119 [Dissostichus eleginoides]|nr:hypothetical protein NQZ68_004119 [Dissostichus eleginoides]
MVGGERGGSAGLVHLSQAASLPVLLPPPRERSTAVTGKPYCPERGSHSSPPSSNPLSLHLFAQTPLQEDETNQQAPPLCSQPAQTEGGAGRDGGKDYGGHPHWCASTAVQLDSQLQAPNERITQKVKNGSDIDGRVFCGPPDVRISNIFQASKHQLVYCTVCVNKLSGPESKAIPARQSFKSSLQAVGSR